MLNSSVPSYFVGGTVNQRASLTSIGNTVIAGFGGHCDNFNYTGMLVAVSKTTGVGVTSIIAMEASPGMESSTTKIFLQLINLRCSSTTGTRHHGPGWW